MAAFTPPKGWTRATPQKELMIKFAEP